MSDCQPIRSSAMLLITTWPQYRKTLGSRAKQGNGLCTLRTQLFLTTWGCNDGPSKCDTCSLANHGSTCNAYPELLASSPKNRVSCPRCNIGCASYGYSVFERWPSLATWSHPYWTYAGCWCIGLACVIQQVSVTIGNYTCCARGGYEVIDRYLFANRQIKLCHPYAHR
jgi:hypothetical protein